MGDLTLFEALTGGAFDRLSWQHSGEFDQIFQKSQMPRGLPGGGMGGFGIDQYITAYFRHSIEKRSIIKCNGPPTPPPSPKKKV